MYITENRLSRYCYSTQGTFGVLRLRNYNDSNKPYKFLTVERPWLDNKASVSCIPEGRYELGLRESGVVARTSGGMFKSGYEIKDVPGRTFIMMHVANTMDDLEGCVGLGLAPAFIKGKWAVSSSRSAFKQFMEAMSEQSPAASILIEFDKLAIMNYKQPY